MSQFSLQCNSSEKSSPLPTFSSVTPSEGNNMILTTELSSMLQHGRQQQAKNYGEAISILGGVYTREAAHAKDSKRLMKSDLQATQKEKREHQGEELLRTRQQEALQEAEGVIYEPGVI